MLHRSENKITQINLVTRLIKITYRYFIYNAEYYFLQYSGDPDSFNHSCKYTYIHQEVFIK